MNEKLKTIILLLIISIIFIFAVMFYMISNKKFYLDIINLKKKIVENKTIVYIDSTDCYYCDMMKPVMEDLKKRYNFQYNQVTIDNYPILRKKKLFKVLQIDKYEVNLPYIAVYNNGKLVKEHEGYTDEFIIFDIFQKYGIISGKENLYLNYLDELEFEELEGRNIILVGELDSNLISIRNRIRKVAQEKNLIISYLDFSLMDTDSYYNMREKLDKIPAFIIYEDGKIKDVLYDLDNKNINEFLSKNGY